MSLPQVKNFANEPGGPLVYALGGINALANNMHLQKINHIKSQYAPLTERANAASKLAYANLTSMQPLFNLLKNDPAFAQLSEEEKQAFIKRVQAMGMGGSTGGPLSNSFNEAINFQPQNRNPLGWVFDKFKDLIHSNPNQQQNPLNLSMNGQGQPNQPQNALTSLQNRQAQPSQNSLMAPRNQQEPAVNAPVNEQQQPGIPEGWNPDLIKAQEKWERSPEGKAEIAKNGANAMAPPDEELLAKFGPKRTNANPMELKLTQGVNAPKEKTYEENAIESMSQIAEGPEEGKIRVKERQNLDNQYQQALQTEVPLKHMNKIVSNPKFQKMRQFPWVQEMQLNAKSKIGTPEEQKLIGDFKATSLAIIAETVKSFGGRVLASEIPLSSNMKISPDDTIGVMLGKLPSIETFAEMTKQRSLIASKLMQKLHLNKGEALEQADKMVNGQAIRKAIEKQLEPKEQRISDEDIDFTAKKHGMTRDQVIQRLKAEGRYHG